MKKFINTGSKKSTSAAKNISISVKHELQIKNLATKVDSSLNRSKKITIKTFKRCNDFLRVEEGAAIIFKWKQSFIVHQVAV